MKPGSAKPEYHWPRQVNTHPTNIKLIGHQANHLTQWSLGDLNESLDISFSS